MSTTTLIIIIVVVAAIVAVGALAAVVMTRQRRRAQLARRFGSEWDRTVDAQGGPKAAAADLQERTERRQRLDIHPLSPTARDHYQQEWRQVQAEFVDEPASSLTLADGLVARVMHDRGYPIEKFESNADLVSVDHPEVVEHYRNAHGTFVAAQTGSASTEEMRTAFVSYRALFSDLLEDDQSAPMAN
jgi:hypothetical protein